MIWQHLFEYCLGIYFEFNGTGKIDPEENVRDLILHVDTCREIGGVNVDGISLERKVELITAAPRLKFPFCRELEHLITDWEAMVWAKEKANQLLLLVKAAKRNAV